MLTSSRSLRPQYPPKKPVVNTLQKTIYSELNELSDRLNKAYTMILNKINVDECDEKGLYETLNAHFKKNPSEDTVSDILYQMRNVRVNHPWSKVCIPYYHLFISCTRFIETYLSVISEHDHSYIQEALMPDWIADCINNGKVETWKIIKPFIKRKYDITIRMVGSSRIYWEAYEMGIYDPMFHQRIRIMTRLWRKQPTKRVSFKEMCEYCEGLKGMRALTAWYLVDTPTKLLAQLHVILKGKNIGGGLQYSYLYDQIENRWEEIEERLLELFSFLFKKRTHYCVDILVKFPMVASYYAGRELVFDHHARLHSRHLRFQKLIFNEGHSEVFSNLLSRYSLWTFAALWKITSKLSYEVGIALLKEFMTVEWTPPAAQVDHQAKDIEKWLRAFLPEDEKYPKVREWVYNGAPTFNASGSSGSFNDIIREGRKLLETLSTALKEGKSDTVKSIVGNQIVFAQINSQYVI